MDHLAIHGHRVERDGQNWVCARCQTRCGRLREYRDLYCDPDIQTVGAHSD